MKKPIFVELKLPLYTRLIAQANRHSLTLRGIVESALDKELDRLETLTPVITVTGETNEAQPQ